MLVNNAAVMEEVPFDAPLEEWHHGWERAYRINVLATADLTRAARPHFVGARRRGDRDDVVVGRAARLRQHVYAAYAASKAAVKALTQTVARHYGSHGVLCYALAPGVVRTQLSEQAAELFGGEEVVLSGLATGEMVPPVRSGRARRLPGHGPRPSPDRRDTRRQRRHVHPMKFGIWHDFRNPPEWHVPYDRLYRENLEQVELAEELGYESVWVSEHHVTADGYLPSVFPLLAAIAHAHRARCGSARRSSSGRSSTRSGSPRTSPSSTS